jgi:hypothetical protein
MGGKVSADEKEDEEDDRCDPATDRDAFPDERTTIARRC